MLKLPAYDPAGIVVLGFGILAVAALGRAEKIPANRQEEAIVDDDEAVGGPHDFALFA